MDGQSALNRSKPIPVAASERGAAPIGKRARRWRFGLQVKLILPYLLLTLALALVAIFIITQLVSGSARLGFNGQLQAVQDSASDGLARIERSQLESLRLLAFTQGLPEAMASGSAERVADLVTPLALNAGLPVVTLIDTTGRELVTLTLTAGGAEYARSGGADLSQVAIVRRVLAGEQDARGDKFVGILAVQSRRFLFTSAPISDGTGAHLGVVMLGQDLSQVLRDVARVSRADVLVALDSSGRALDAVLPPGASDVTPLEVEPDVAQGLLKAPTVAESREVNLGGSPYAVLTVPLNLRDEPAALLGVGLNASSLRRQEEELRLLLSGLFGVGLLAVLGVGYGIYRSIVDPVDRLRTLADAVAEGDLNQRLTLPQDDEISDLALAFSEMTERLAERTHEAERLHGETAERARQLEDSNQRLRQAQQQLVQSEKLASIGQLTAGIVHDVKNPLAVIKGIAELVQIEDPGLSAFAREQIGLIRDNASHANAIVSDLLMFARQSTPKWQHQDLRETVQAALRLTEYLMRQAGVRSIADLPDVPVMTVYDSRQIEQVLINLIQNAVQAMSSGGALTIALNVMGQHALLTVADTGVGIGPEQIGRVFDPFYTTKSEGEGTGLGLSVTYGIISQHGGEIWASSERDRGTTFSIRLPIREQAPEQPV
ncbi:MAG: HAMP domain-containing protein [Anaerolineales bacterium]|nr:HAMP domain-containing protein [Anaerolineales bacterium]